MTEESGRLHSRFPLIVAVSVFTFVGSVVAFEIVEETGLLAEFLCKSNIIKYAFSVIVFALTFVVTCIVSWAVPGKGKSILNRELEKKTYYCLFLLSVLIAGILLLHRRFFAEVNDFAFPLDGAPLHLISKRYALALIVSITLLALAFSRSKKDISVRWVFLGYLAALSLTFAATLLLDPTRGDLYHGIAYLESIYNVLHGVPYTLDTTGIYGHYGLFLAPLLRLFGGSTLVMMLLMSALICGAAAACIYCIHNLIEENWLRILASFACCMFLITMRSRNYWQLQPHRILFPMLVCAWLVHLTNKNRLEGKVRELCGGWILSVAAILWNTESGLFCAISIASAFLVHNLQTRRWYQPEMLLRYALHIILIIGSVAAAVGVMNVYNYLCGYRTLEISLFFFPMGVSDYMDGVLRYDLAVENDAWVYVLILFSGLLLAGFYYTSIFCKRTESLAARYAPLCVAVAVLGLLGFSYYVNRAAYCNLEITFQLACIAMCIFWRMYSKAWKNIKEEPRTIKHLSKALVSVICLIVTSVLALQSVMLTGKFLGRKVDNGHYDTRVLQEVCNVWEENIPKDTFAFGAGVSFIYEELGWDPGGRYRDISDLFLGGDRVLDAISNDVLEHDSFAVLSTSGTERAIISHILELDQSYILTKEIPLPMIPPQLDNCVLLYYSRA